MTEPSLALYWRTVRHLRGAQLGCLVRRRVFGRRTLAKHVGGPAQLRWLPHAPEFPEWNPSWSRYQRALANTSRTRKQGDGASIRAMDVLSQPLARRCNR